MILKTKYPMMGNGAATAAVTQSSRRVLFLDGDFIFY
jgi:hypothetical protein